MATDQSAVLIATGDIVMNEPDPSFYFAPSASVFAAADIPIAHVEVPHTARGQQTVGGIPAKGSPVEYLSTLADLGVKAATLASNHSFDAGINGIVDTVEELHRLGITTTGSGVNLAEARKPALAEANGVRVAVLSYNCVGPVESWASAGKPGCAYIHVITHYEPEMGMSGHPSEMYTFATPKTLAALAADIEAVRPNVDIVVVALHKGMGHTRAVVQDYEKQVAHAAIDAGADIIISHHAHIMRGIEIYKGHPIYHGLGNFMTVSRSLSLENNDSPERQAWAKRRRELFGFEPDPNMPTYAFHPQSRNTALARCVVSKNGVVEAGLIPCWIDDEVRPVPVARDKGGEKVVDYIKAITEEVGFDTRFEWDGDRIVFDLG